MENLNNLIIKPMLYILNYRIEFWNVSFSILNVIFFEFLIALVVLLIRFITHSGD